MDERLCQNRENTHFMVDLDQTLVASTANRDAKCGPQEQLEGIVDPSAADFEIDDKDMGPGFTFKRRWTDTTLRVLSRWGHVHVFSAGTLDYVEQIVEALDPAIVNDFTLYHQKVERRYIEQVRARRHCKDVGDRNRVKDLLDIVHNFGAFHASLLIDDKRRSFLCPHPESRDVTRNQEPNGIQVRPFYKSMGQDMCS